MTRRPALLRVGRQGRRICFWLVFCAFVGTIGVTYGLPLWYQAHGERIILIDSYEPRSSFGAGDAIVVNEVVDPSQLQIGQIVTFTYQDEITGAPTLVTHSIIGFVSLPETTPDGKPKIDPSTGQGRTIRYIRTQGEGSSRADAQLTELAKIRGVVLQVKRHWGSWLLWAQSSSGRISLFGPPLAMLLLAEMLSWRRQKPTLAVRVLRPARRTTEGRAAA